MDRTIGLSGPQRFVVRLVGWQPGISPGELAEILHLHRSSVTSLLNGLVRAGFVQRRPNPRDGRGIALSLTRRGVRVNRLSAGTVEAAIRGAVVGIPPGRLRAAKKVLIVLGRALNVGGPSTTPR
jgi:DNA-binding MarR family transcriptional regulator